MKYLILLGMFLFSAHINAFETGNDLVEAMKEYEKADAGKEANWMQVGLFMGYVTGTTDVFRMYGSACVPDTAPRDQIYAVVIKHLKSMPELWTQKAEVLVGATLSSAFPCEAE